MGPENGAPSGADMQGNMDSAAEARVNELRKDVESRNYDDKDSMSSAEISLEAQGGMNAESQDRSALENAVKTGKDLGALNSVTGEKLIDNEDVVKIFGSDEFGEASSEEKVQILTDAMKKKSGDQKVRHDLAIGTEGKAKGPQFADELQAQAVDIITRKENAEKAADALKEMDKEKPDYSIVDEVTGRTLIDSKKIEDIIKEPDFQNGDDETRIDMLQSAVKKSRDAAFDLAHKNAAKKNYGPDADWDKGKAQEVLDKAREAGALGATETPTEEAAEAKIETTEAAVEPGEDLGEEQGPEIASRGEELLVDEESAKALEKFRGEEDEVVDAEFIDIPTAEQEGARLLEAAGEGGDPEKANSALLDMIRNNRNELMKSGIIAVAQMALSIGGVRAGIDGALWLRNKFAVDGPIGAKWSKSSMQNRLIRLLEAQSGRTVEPGEVKKVIRERDEDGKTQVQRDLAGLREQDKHIKGMERSKDLVPVVDKAGSPVMRPEYDENGIPIPGTEVPLMRRPMSPERELRMRMLMEARQQKYANSEVRQNVVENVMNKYVELKVTGRQVAKEALNSALLYATPLSGVGLMAARLGVMGMGDVWRGRANMRKESLAASMRVEGGDAVTLAQLMRSNETNFQGVGLGKVVVDRTAKLLRDIRGDEARSEQDQKIARIRGLAKIGTYVGIAVFSTYGEEIGQGLRSTGEKIDSLLDGLRDSNPFDGSGEAVMDVAERVHEVDITIPTEEITGEVGPTIPSQEYMGGNSIWAEVDNQLDARFEGKIDELAGDNAQLREALETYNIDKVKNVIVASPQSFGLPEGADVDSLTSEQLNNINWDQAFKGAFPEGTLEGSLTAEQVSSIVENNETLREYFKANPDVPITSETVRVVLGGQEADLAAVAEGTPDLPIEERAAETARFAKAEEALGNRENAVVIDSRNPDTFMYYTRVDDGTVIARTLASGENGPTLVGTEVLYDLSESTPRVQVETEAGVASPLEVAGISDEVFVERQELWTQASAGLESVGDVEEVTIPFTNATYARRTLVAPGVVKWDWLGMTRTVSDPSRGIIEDALIGEDF